MINPIFKDDNAITFLKQEFGENYSYIVKKIINEKTQTADPLAYHIYKTYAIVNIAKIYDVNEYHDWLKSHNVEINEMKL